MPRRFWLTRLSFRYKSVAESLEQDGRGALDRWEVCDNIDLMTIVQVQRVRSRAAGRLTCVSRPIGIRVVLPAQVWAHAQAHSQGGRRGCHVHIAWSRTKSAAACSAAAASWSRFGQQLVVVGGCLVACASGRLGSASTGCPCRRQWKRPRVCAAGVCSVWCDIVCIRGARSIRTRGTREKAREREREVERNRGWRSEGWKETETREIERQAVLMGGNR
jgi:hypothetical protein